MAKEHILSLTKKDFNIQTFKSGGKGGQSQNKTDSGVRIIHIQTGLQGESRDGKSQHQNKKIAFNRLVNSNEFQNWLKIKSKEIITKQTIHDKVEEMIQPDNIKNEIKVDGKWIEVDNII